MTPAVKFLSEQLRAMDWQPIETAPRDGTEILLYREDCGVILGRWIACCEFLIDGDPSNEFCEAGNDEAWEEPDWFGADFISGYRISNDGVPTHWAPLPSVPSESSLLSSVASALEDAERERDANHNLAVANGERAKEEHYRAESAEAKLAEAVKVIEQMTEVVLHDATMEGPRISGINGSAARRADEAARRFLSSVKGEGE